MGGLLDHAVQRGERFTRNDSNTLVITLRRRAPDAVLLVRPASRSFAGPRCNHSAKLFVGSTSGLSTKVNSSSSNRRCVSSSAKLANSRSRGGISGVVCCQWGRHRSLSRPSNSATFCSRPSLPSRPSAAARLEPLPSVAADAVDQMAKLS